MTRSEVARRLQALAKKVSVGSKPRVKHLEGIPIGSRETLNRRYLCDCVECRKARGNYPNHLLKKKKPKTTRK